VGRAQYFGAAFGLKASNVPRVGGDEASARYDAFDGVSPEAKTVA
jgi:hypothetical protein